MKSTSFAAALILFISNLSITFETAYAYLRFNTNGNFPGLSLGTGGAYAAKGPGAGALFINPASMDKDSSFSFVGSLSTERIRRIFYKDEGQDKSYGFDASEQSSYFGQLFGFESFKDTTFGIAIFTPYATTTTSNVNFGKVFNVEEFSLQTKRDEKLSLYRAGLSHRLIVSD